MARIGQARYKLVRAGGRGFGLAWARCTARWLSTGAELAVKLQYPDMQSAVEADVNQLRVAFAIHARMDPAIDTARSWPRSRRGFARSSITSSKPRHMALYGAIFRADSLIRVPVVVRELTTKRLLAMNWLEGRPLLDYKAAPT